jgi:hypothetical protein
LSVDEADTPVEPFTEKEIKEALDDMKPNNASGPDRLPVEFCKYF